MVDGINNDYARKKWESLITSIESTYNSAQDTLTATLQRPVKLENNANVNQLIPVFEDICKSSKKSGNVKRRFLQSKEWKNALDAVTVRDVRPQKYEDVEVALQWMKLVRDRSEVATLWDSLLNKNGENAICESWRGAGASCVPIYQRYQILA